MLLARADELTCPVCWHLFRSRIDGTTRTQANPVARPLSARADIRAQTRTSGGDPKRSKALQALVGTLDDPVATAAAKVSAAIAVLDRGWGKPTERHELVSLSAIAELSDEDLRNAIDLLRAAPTPPVELGDGGESTDDKAKLN